MQKLHFPFLKQFMHCIFWKFLVVSTENKFLFEDSFNVLFVRIIFLWFFMIFIMAYLWKGFSCGFYDFLHAIFVVMVFVVFCFNPLWFLWFLWFLWSLTFYSCVCIYLRVHTLSDQCRKKLQTFNIHITLWYWFEIFYHI